jgi:hypothetical protein
MFMVAIVFPITRIYFHTNIRELCTVNLKFLGSDTEVLVSFGKETQSVFWFPPESS